MTDKILKDIDKALEDNALDVLPEPGNASSVPAKKAADTGTAPATEVPLSLHQEASKGEKLYNFVVYQGVNYWLNLGMSLVIADYFRNLGGRKYLDNAVNGIASALSKNNPLKFHHAVDIGLKTIALCSGGWVLVAPMKWMEDAKRPLVHWLNKKMGVDMTAPDGHEQTADEIYIEKKQPKQSWGHAYWRRTQAQLAVSVTGYILDKFGAKTLEKAEMIDGKLSTKIGGEKRYTDMISGAVNRGLHSAKIPGNQFLTTNPRAQAYIKFASLDAFYTMITAAVMRFTNGATKDNSPQKIAKPDVSDSVVQDPGLLPQGETPVAAVEALEKEAAAEISHSDKFAKYKKTSIQPAESHTARAQASDGSLAMAP